MIRICMLASGSKGNAIFVETPGAAILVDAGLSGKELARRMKAIGRSPEDLDAVLISHEHSDHVRGVGVLSRRCGTAVHITGRTLERASSMVGKLRCVKEFEPGSPFVIRDCAIYPFEVTHDAVEPVNFIIRTEHAKIGIATDLGYASTLVKENLKSCHALVLEANHDPVMLEQGPYPWPIKQRVKSKRGHLSNEQGAKLLEEVYHQDLEHVCLAHISETNNLPEYALKTVRSILGGKTNGFTLHAASQHQVSPVMTVKGRR
jgi:phosphoribosyl 1,2-cyclic phosphodiesterase